MTSPEATPKFVADHMLGSLARWLRMIGYDTVYEKKLDDAMIATMAKEQGRFILTRDKELAKEPIAFLVEPDDLEEQLKAVGQKYGLRLNEATIRCSSCNGDLVDLPKEQAKGEVPEGAYSGNDKFWRCAKCGKVYWKGTHWRGIMERLKKLNLA
ncbi:MAG: Mut7-C RNAse domain-containing protein [Thermoplasmata archaeon]|nr:Mut7-C RNAse domain-containing protein [Thermoplasmata archaeon]